MERKSRILKAVTAGHSYEEILANDGSITYRDIFQVVSEAPTSFWRKAAAKKRARQLPYGAIVYHTAVQHRRD